MLQAKRRKEIVKYINQHQNVSTTELSEAFNTSAVTIRSDIKALPDPAAASEDTGRGDRQAAFASYSCPLYTPYLSGHILNTVSFSYFYI